MATTRTWASQAQSLHVAKHCVSHKLGAKAFLEPSRYVARLNGVEVNIDYRVVEAMMFVLSTNTPTKVKRTTAKLKDIPTI